MGLVGVTGSGKTYTAMKLGCALAEKYDSRLGYIDTEMGSAKKYADMFDFDVIELGMVNEQGQKPEYTAQNYIDCMDEFAKAGHKVLVIDSLSHAWSGVGGVLDYVDNVSARSASKNSYTAWREGSKEQNKLVDAMLAFPGHLIITMRSKMEYVIEKNDKGKTIIRKVGMQPVQREGLEYEFDIVGDMDQQHVLIISKTRNASMDEKVYRKPGKDLFIDVSNWISDPKDVAPTIVQTFAENEVDLDKLHDAILKGEKMVYVDKEGNIIGIAIINARKKHIKGTDLDKAPNGLKVSYRNHLRAKYKAMVEKEKESGEGVASVA